MSVPIFLLFTSFAFALPVINGELNFLSDDEFYFKLKVNHLNLQGVDIAFDIKGEGKLLYDRNENMVKAFGSVNTEYWLVNHRPMEKLTIFYELSASCIKLVSLDWGSLRAKGSVNLSGAPRLKLRLYLNGTEIEELVRSLGMDLEGLPIAGRLIGEFQLEGPLNDIYIRGMLQAGEGRFGEMEFQAARLSLEGYWPRLHFIDSEIVESSGIIYSVEGGFDLARLDDLSSPEHKVDIHPLAQRAFRWQDWVIARKGDSLQGEEGVELEYKLKSNDFLNMRLGEEEETLSWQKVLRF